MPAQNPSRSKFSIEVEAFNEEDEDQYEDNYATGDRILNTDRHMPVNVLEESPEIFDYLNNSHQFDAMMENQRNTMQMPSQDFFEDPIQKPP